MNTTTLVLITIGIVCNSWTMAGAVMYFSDKGQFWLALFSATIGLSVIPTVFVAGARFIES